MSMPAYHRRIRVDAGEMSVTALLEDDFHAMRVTLRHDGTYVNAVEPHVVRAPWSTCPGAEAKLVETFEGLPLREVSARRDKPMNCTHLHDLAVLAAAHAHAATPLLYEMIATDPVAGARTLELRRDGEQVLCWEEQDGRLTAPSAVAGQTLFTLRDWIATLDPAEREAARLLQWASIVAHGRTIPTAEQSTASAMPASCYTFQPARAAVASRTGERRDFSAATHVPLDVFRDMR